VRLRLERIPEEDHEVYAPVDDGGPDLLIAPSHRVRVARAFRD